jgi:HEAT repeat protein
MKRDPETGKGADRRKDRRLSARSIRPVIGAALAAGLLIIGVPVSRSAAHPAGTRSPAGVQVDPQPEETPSDWIGILDFYGLRTVTRQQIREALGLKEGGRVPQSEAEIGELVRRLEKVPGVLGARLARVCCDEQGRTILYVGIKEKGALRFTYRAAPTGRASLPAETVVAYRRYEEVRAAAVQKGDAGEDDSQGHSLAANPAVRSFQEQFILYAASHLRTLRQVLRYAGDAEQRGMAAEIIGYAPNKREVVADLLSAIRDPDEGVRNNATRALMAIAALAQRQPQRRIRIEAAPFIAMLNSVVWTDRNKAAAVLFFLTAHPPARALDQLRKQALPSLVEMARWKNPGHAFEAYFLLGRIAGLDESAVRQAWTRGEREQVIARALKRAS